MIDVMICTRGNSHGWGADGAISRNVNFLVDREIDLSVFEQRYRNDETGEPGQRERAEGS